jgi:hypothetical protein
MQSPTDGGQALLLRHAALVLLERLSFFGYVV